jgi:hypothetical protein
MLIFLLETDVTSAVLHLSRIIRYRSDASVYLVENLRFLWAGGGTARTGIVGAETLEVLTGL